MGQNGSVKKRWEAVVFVRARVHVRAHASAAGVRHNFLGGKTPLTKGSSGIVGKLHGIKRREGVSGFRGRVFFFFFSPQEHIQQRCKFVVDKTKCQVQSVFLLQVCKALILTPHAHLLCERDVREEGEEKEVDDVSGRKTSLGPTIRTPSSRGHLCC